MKSLNVRIIKFENIELRILECKDVNSIYVSWLNNNQVVMFTEQGYISFARINSKIR